MTEQTTPTAPDDADERDRIAGLRALPSWEEPEAYRGSVGRTMFDTPGAKDNTVTVLLPTDAVQRVPAIVTTAVRGATFMPRYHGRVQVEIIGDNSRPEQWCRHGSGRFQTDL